MSLWKCVSLSKAPRTASLLILNQVLSLKQIAVLTLLCNIHFLNYSHWLTGKLNAVYPGSVLVLEMEITCVWPTQTCNC